MTDARRVCFAAAAVAALGLARASSAPENVGLPSPMTPPLSSLTYVAPRSTALTLVPSTPIEQLGETIADLAARIHAATYELLVMLREFDERNGWTNGRNGGRTRWHCSPSRHSTTISSAAPVLTGTRS